MGYEPETSTEKELERIRLELILLEQKTEQLLREEGKRLQDLEQPYFPRPPTDAIQQKRAREAKKTAPSQKQVIEDPLERTQDTLRPPTDAIQQKQVQESGNRGKPSKRVRETLPKRTRDAPHKTGNKQRMRENGRKQPEKKGWIGEVLFYGVLVLLVLGVAVIKINSKGTPVSFAGYTAQIVLTGSMEDVIPQGSLVISKRVDPSALEIGDDITYMASQTTTVTHRIVGITEKYQNTGQRAFQTQGVMNDEPDKLPVPAANVVGKVVFYSPSLGQIANFVSKNWPFLLFLILLLAAFVKIMQRILRKDSEST